MAGLFVKDIRLLLQRKQTLILFLVVALFMGFTMEGTFIIGYMSLIVVVFTIGTISFDEADNCYPFLMTLPIKRSDYVKEKYIFCFLGGLCGWVLSVVIYLIANISRGIPIDIGSELLKAAIYIPVLIVICSVMISFQLKFGVEKSRIVTIILCGGITAVGLVGSKLLKNTDIEMSVWIEKLNQVSGGVLLAISLLVAITIFIGSYLWSLSFMNKKEY